MIARFMSFYKPGVTACPRGQRTGQGSGVSRRRWRRQQLRARAWDYAAQLTGKAKGVKVHGVLGGEAEQDRARLVGAAAWARHTDSKGEAMRSRRWRKGTWRVRARKAATRLAGAGVSGQGGGAAAMCARAHGHGVSARTQRGAGTARCGAGAFQGRRSGVCSVGRRERAGNVQGPVRVCAGALCACMVGQRRRLSFDGGARLLQKRVGRGTWATMEAHRRRTVAGQQNRGGETAA